MSVSHSDSYAVTIVLRLEKVVKTALLMDLCDESMSCCLKIAVVEWSRSFYHSDFAKP